MPLALWFIAFLFTVMQWYKKYIEPDLLVKLNADLKADWQPFLNRLLKRHVELVDVTDPDSGETTAEPRLREGFDLSVREEMVRITLNHRTALDVEKKIKRLNFIHDYYVWLVIAELVVLTAQFSVEKLDILHLPAHFSMPCVSPAHLTWITSRLEATHNTLTLFIILTTAGYLYNFLRIYNYGAFKWSRR